MLRRTLVSYASLAALASLLGACSPAPPPPATAPCMTFHGDAAAQAKEAEKTIEELAEHIRLPPEDEALRHPKSIHHD